MSFTPAEIQTLRDLTYIARQANPPADISSRLGVLGQALAAGTSGSWSDPDRGLILGYTADTVDGKYWRALLDRLAAEIGVTIQAVVTQPAPTPAPTVPAPVPVPITGDFAAQLVAALATYDIHIAPGKLAIGMKPDMGADAQFQIGGRGSAEILGRSNMAGLDGQNPGEVHSNVLSVAGNDGGMRLIQYAYWGNGGKQRNTMNRPNTILAIDSMGDICVSDDRIAYGQVFYLVKRVSQGFIDLCTYQVGHSIRVLKSVAGYGAADSQQL